MEELRDAKGLTEKEFLEIYKTKNYPRPYLTADVLVFGKNNDDIYLLLIKRKGHPFINKWAIVGGFAEENEPIELTALRELQEETSLTKINVSPVGIFSKPNRDPRGWIVTMAYYGVVQKNKCMPIASDDAKEAKWFKVTKNNEEVSLISEDEQINIILDSNGNDVNNLLAFDHAEIILKALSLV